MRYLRAILLIIIVFVSVIYVQSMELQPLEDEGLAQVLQKQIETNFLDFENLGYQGGMTMAVHVRGKGLWTGAAGYADVGDLQSEGNSDISPIVMKSDDLFRIGSLTKAMISVLTLKLVEEGQLSLDDTIEKWLPDSQIPNIDIITIRHLLSHTSGVFDIEDIPDIDNIMKDVSVTPEDIIWEMEVYDPYFTPGENAQFHYSNTNYVIIGMILEKATGESLSALFRRVVLEPMQLSDTYFGGWGYEEPPASDVAGYYTYYDASMIDGYDLSWRYCSGNVISTVDNYIRFLLQLFDADFLTSESVNQMIAPQYGTTESGYGLGVYSGVMGGSVYTLNSTKITDRLIHHSGGVPGFCTWFLYDVQNGITIVGMANNAKTYWSKYLFNTHKSTFDYLEGSDLPVVKLYKENNVLAVGAWNGSNESSDLAVTAELTDNNGAVYVQDSSAVGGWPEDTIFRWKSVFFEDGSGGEEPQWQSRDFDDSGWEISTGTGFTIGYGTALGEVGETLLDPTVETVYTRSTFDISNYDSITGLTLRLEGDDTAAAWINGEYAGYAGIPLNDSGENPEIFQWDTSTGYAETDYMLSEIANYHGGRTIYLKVELADSIPVNVQNWSVYD